MEKIDNVDFRLIIICKFGGSKVENPIIYASNSGSKFSTLTHWVVCYGKTLYMFVKKYQEHAEVKF